MLEHILQTVLPAGTAAKPFDPPASHPPTSPIKPSITISTTELNPLTANLNPSALTIQASPYTDPLNHLALQTLDLQPKLFALALTHMDRTTPDYATAPYTTSFNFATVFEALRALCEESNHHWERQDFYVVIFRSKLQPTADRARLGELDQMSHQEACASGGLLKYWFGSPDAELRNLATCIWRNREDAAAGGRGPWHKKARSAARELYDTISFHTHKLVVEDGATSWRLEDYRD